MSGGALAVHFSTGKDDWRTPPEIFDPLNAEFSFGLDAAASDENRLCSAYFSMFGLAGSWDGWGAVWCNPPYSRGLQGKFIAKAAAERRKGVLTVMLLPARTDTRAFHEYIWNRYEHAPKAGVEVRFLKGRVRFVGAPASAPFPPMIVVFRP